MTTTELNLRIQKAKDKVQKKQGTIEKKERWIATGKYDTYSIGYFNEDIKRLHSEISETQATIAKYEIQLATETKRERSYNCEIPEAMKLLELELVNRWNEYDIARRNYLADEYETLGYKRWVELHKSSTMILYRTDEEIQKDNEAAARSVVIDLYNRVSLITGEVTDWSNVFANGTALNGTVIGKEGRAKVESILAGGYNIQRLHVRVLVHSI